MAEARTWTLVIPAPDGYIYSSNADHQAGWHRVAERRKTARQCGFGYARAAQIPPLRRARVEPVIRIANWKRADPGNYPGGSTLKGIVDGLVDAKVVPDDRQEFLELAMPTLAPTQDGRGREIILCITELPVAPPVAMDGAP